MTSRHTASAYSHLASAMCEDDDSRALFHIYRAQDALDAAVRDMQEQQVSALAVRTVSQVTNTQRRGI